MSNDNNIQDLFFNSQREDKNSILGMKNVAEGVEKYFSIFMLAFFSPILFIIMTLFFLGAITLYDKNISGVYYMNGVFAIFISIALGYSSYCVIKQFCKTPHELYPNAAKTIIISFVLWFIVHTIYILSYLTPLFFPESSFFIDLAFHNIVSELMLLILSFYSYYSFYSFLNVIGEKTMEIGCKDAIRCLIASYIVFAINIIVGVPVFYSNGEITLSSAFTVTGNLPSFVLGYAIYALGVVYLFLHINTLYKYFERNGLIKNGSSENSSKESANSTSVNSWLKIILGVIFIIVGLIRFFYEIF